MGARNIYCKRVSRLKILVMPQVFLENPVNTAPTFIIRGSEKDFG